MLLSTSVTAVIQYVRDPLKRAAGADTALHHRTNRAGVVNLLVATAPLLGAQPHSVLLTSFMAAVGTRHLHKDTEAFYKKLLCMTSQDAALLIGTYHALHFNP